MKSPERFAGNFRLIRVPRGCTTWLPACGLVDESFGLAFALRDVWTARGQPTLPVAHRLPTLSSLSPTGSTALQQQVFIS